MKQDCLYKLEYNKILEMLSNHCKTYIGKDLAKSLKPSFNKEKVKLLLDETNETLSLIDRKGLAPLYEINNISVYIKQLESNINLTAKALIDIANILKISRELKEYFYNDKDFPISDFSILDSYFSSLYSNKSLEKSISDAFTKAGYGAGALRALDWYEEIKE